ncbi:unnamed protein product [Urochloa humidicola]
MGISMGKKILTLAISLLAVLALLLQPCAAARPVSQTPTIDGSRSLRLPLLGSLLRGPESVAFDGNDAGPYSGVSDGRILKWNGPVLGWSTYAYGPGYDAKACTASRTRPQKPRRASAAAHWVYASTTSPGTSTSPTHTRG